MSLTPSAGFVELVDLLDALRELHNEGLEADLRPLADHITELVDAMPRHASVFQLLGRVHDHRKAMPIPLRQAAVAVEALHVGRRHGLPRRDLLVLGLACSLAVVLETADASEAAGELLRYRTLGALGPDVLETVLTPYQLAEPEPDSPAAIYLMADAFHVLLRTQSGPDALARLASGTVPRVARALARKFALIKGAWPVGTIVSLSSGRLALVIGWASGQAHGRPIVQPLEAKGGLGVALDLAEIPGIHIIGSVAPADERLDLTALHSNERQLAHQEAFAIGRNEGPSVSLSYNFDQQAIPPETSTEFDLSIDDSLMSNESIAAVLKTTLEHPG